MQCKHCKTRQRDFSGQHCRRCKMPENGIAVQHSMPPQSSPEGTRKAEICRSNTCGFYDAQRDCCKILADKGKAGRVNYLLSRPTTRCVAENPLF